MRTIDTFILLAVGSTVACSSPAAGPSPAGEQPEATATATAANLADEHGVPHFAQPEQRTTYLEAMIRGDRRAIEVIDDAIALLKKSPNADPNQLAALERSRADRSARLAQHQTAR